MHVRIGLDFIKLIVIHVTLNGLRLYFYKNQCRVSHRRGLCLTLLIKYSLEMCFYLLWTNVQIHGSLPKTEV